MTHAEPTIVKVRIYRAWNDLAPKLKAFLAGSGTAAILVSVLHNYAGVTIDPALAAVFVSVAGTVLGYFVPDKVDALDY